MTEFNKKHNILYSYFTFRIMVGIILLISLFLTVYYGKSLSLFVYLFHLIFPTIIVILILLTSFATGHLFFKSILNKYFPKGVIYYLSTVLGIGIISHIVLMFGIINLYYRKVIFIVFALIVIFSIRELKYLAFLLQSQFTKFYSKKISILSLFLFIAIFIVLCIYLLNSFAPSVNYDVLEYHLGALKHFAAAKDISPVPNNFYSALPYNIEMIYLLAGFLEGYFGGYTPKIFVFFLIILNSIGIYLILFSAGFKSIYRLLGILLFITNQTIFRLGFDAFNDLGVALYLSAFLIVIIYWIKNLEYKIITIGGVFLGFMLSCKYTVFGMYIFPALTILMPLLFFYHYKIVMNKLVKRDNKSFIKHIVISYLLIISAALLTYSPWLIKGSVKSGNPIYPFFNNIFKSETWTNNQNEFLFKAHGKVQPFSIAHFQNCYKRINGIGVIYILPLLSLFFIRKNKILIFPFLFYVISVYFIWNLVSNAPDRFLAPIIHAAILLQIYVIKKIVNLKFRFLPILLYTVFFIFSIITQISTSLAIGIPQTSLGIMTEEEYLKKNLNEEFIDVVNYANEKIPVDSKILLIYEARQYLFNSPVLLNTVFDQSPVLNAAKKYDSAEEIIDYFKKLGYEYVLVNEFELSRFIHFYTPHEEQKLRNISYIINNNPYERINYIEFYGPYMTDPEFNKNKDKIYDFMLLLERNIIYKKTHPTGLMVYISKI